MIEAKPKKLHNSQHEHREQCFLIEWVKLNQKKYDGLDLLHCSLNGMSMTMPQAVRAKRAGMKKGIPDICLPVPKNGFIGLYIELKYGNNKTSKNQDAVIERLRHFGHKVVVCWSWHDAVKEIEGYYNEQ